MINRIISIVVLLCLCTGCQKEFKGPAYVNKMRQNFEEFAEHTSEKYDVEWFRTGLGFAAGVGRLIDSYRCHYAFNFVSSKLLDQDEARKLATSMAHDLIESMYHNEAYAEWLVDSHELMPKSYPSTELEVENMGFKLTFWDENTDRPLAPCVAQVRFVEGELRYYYADPETQALQEPPVVEKYQHI